MEEQGKEHQKKEKYVTYLMKNSLFEALYHFGIQRTLDQVLTLVPRFRDLLFQKILQKKGLESVAKPITKSDTIWVDDVEFKVPTIIVKYQNHFLDGVLLDGSSRVKIVRESIYLKFGSHELHPAPFQVKMAN